MATRFTLPPRCLAQSTSGINLAAAGDDEGIKLIDLAGNKVFRSLRSEPYVRGLAYDPEGEYLAATTADGTLTVWNMTSGKAEVKKKKTCARIDLLAPARLRPAWHPDGGSILAAPASDGSIVFYERLSWENAGELTGQHADAVQLLAFSKNGLYLASTAADQSLVLWDVNERKVLAKRVLPGTACGLVWHPSGNAMAVITDDGELSVWNSPVPSNLPSPTADVDALLRGKKAGGPRAKGGHGPGDRMVDDQAMDDGDGEEDVEEDEDDDGDDDGLGNSTRRRRRRPSSSRYPDMYDDANGVTFTMDDLPQPQPPIQPGSTTMDFGRQYLSYTPMGAITLRTESDHNTVEVSFHDTARARRRVPLLTDFFGFSLGALGEEGALYASPSTAEAPSTVVYRPFESWAPNSEWSFGLPAGEEVVCIAAGATFVAVATSQRNLRFFSPSGLQTGLMTLPGAAVALTARGDTLAVAWHAGQPTPTGDQVMMVSEFAVHQQRLLLQRPLALSPSSTLTWFGYTEEKALCTYDSEGVLRVLSPEFGGSWCPVFAAGAERQGGEHFWVFAVSLRRNEVQCIVCADTPEPVVPSGSARPVVTAAPLRLPVVNHDEAQAPLELDILRQKLLISHFGVELATAQQQQGSGGANPEEEEEVLMELEKSLRQAQNDADRSALRLFTRLAQSDRQARALEVAAGLQTITGLHGAVKIANHHRMSTLAESVASILAQKEQQFMQYPETQDFEYVGVVSGGYEEVQGGEGEAVEGASVPVPVPAQSPGLGLGVLRNHPAFATSGGGDGGIGANVQDENVAVNNNNSITPSAKVTKAGKTRGGGDKGRAAVADGGAKRKAPAGNPFARKKK